MDTIQSDLFRYGYKNGKGILKALRIPGFRYLFFLRKVQLCKEKSFSWFMYRFVLKRLSIKYGIQIEHRTQIGKGFYIGHFGTIVVNGNSIIGKNCNITHGVTIGQANRGKSKGAPVLGDNVWIGTNAIIVGKINIGDNVLIAPGAFVNVDVPSNSIVIGNPCQITTNQNATLGYINNEI